MQFTRIYSDLKINGLFFLFKLKIDGQPDNFYLEFKSDATQKNVISKNDQIELYIKPIG